jgi:hypothetical protein
MDSSSGIPKVSGDTACGITQLKQKSPFCSILDRRLVNFLEAESWSKTLNFALPAMMILVIAES